MERTYIVDIMQNLDKEIKLQGFVENFRDGKSMAFIVLKDITGKVQITIEKEEHPDMLETLSSHYVLSAHFAEHKSILDFHDIRFH